MLQIAALYSCFLSADSSSINCSRMPFASHDNDLFCWLATVVSCSLRVEDTRMVINSVRLGGRHADALSTHGISLCVVILTPLQSVLASRPLGVFPHSKWAHRIATSRYQYLVSYTIQIKNQPFVSNMAFCIIYDPTTM